MPALSGDAMSEQRRKELYDLLGLLSERIDQWGELCDAEQFLFWRDFLALRDPVAAIEREMRGHEPGGE